MVTEAAKEAVEGSAQIYVTGLPIDISKSTLNTFFSDYGKVMDVIFKFGSDGKRIKGVAYILFESEETVDKLLAEKTVTIDEKEVEIKKVPEGEGQKDDEDLVAIPKEALKCSVCKMEKFPSVEAYLNHRKGKQHQAVYKIFRGKSASVLKVLQAEAQLASYFTFNTHNTWMKQHAKNPDQCNDCQSEVFCRPEKHETTVEHKMVKNFNNPYCCGHTYTERQKYETHLFSLKHLKNVYEKEQKKEAGTYDGITTIKKAVEVYKQCDEDLKELKETYGEFDPDTELPPLDPSNPVGLNYIVKKIHYHCVCCDQTFSSQSNLVDMHCRSYNHYVNNMTDYFDRVDKQIAAQKRQNEDTESKPNKKMKGAKTENNDEDQYEEDQDQEGNEAQDEVVEEESEEEPAEEQEEDQEIAEESDNEEIQPEEEEEPEVTTPTKEKVSEKPVKDTTKEVKEVVAEEDDEEEEQPTPTRAAARGRGRGQRARGRGRGIKF